MLWMYNSLQNILMWVLLIQAFWAKKIKYVHCMLPVCNDETGIAWLEKYSHLEKKKSLIHSSHCSMVILKFCRQILLRPSIFEVGNVPWLNLLSREWRDFFFYCSLWPWLYLLESSSFSLIFLTTSEIEGSRTSCGSCSFLSSFPALLPLAIQLPQTQ